MTLSDMANLTYFFWIARGQDIFGRGRCKTTHFGEFGGLPGLVETTFSSSLYHFSLPFFHL